MLELAGASTRPEVIEMRRNRLHEALYIDLSRCFCSAVEESGEVLRIHLDPALAGVGHGWNRDVIGAYNQFPVE